MRPSSWDPIPSTLTLAEVVTVYGCIATSVGWKTLLIIITSSESLIFPLHLQKLMQRLVEMQKEQLLQLLDRCSYTRKYFLRKRQLPFALHVLLFPSPDRRTAK